MEKRETGIEPATNSLEGCDSTIELLPRILHLGASPPDPRHALSRAASPARSGRVARSLRSLASRVSRLRHFSRALRESQRRLTSHERGPPARSARSGHFASAQRAESSDGEGRIRTFEGARPTDLQSAAFDRFATSPELP